MQQERDPLNLSGLPPLTPPTDDWPVIEAALKAQQSKRRLWRVSVGGIAAALFMAIAVGLNLQGTADMSTDGIEATSPQVVDANPQPLDASSRIKARDSLIALSQRLETQLRNIRSDITVLPTSALIYQVELEDLVAQVDEELSMNPDSTELWSQRVNLLLDLSQLYKNELRRESRRMASV